MQSRLFSIKQMRIVFFTQEDFFGEVKELFRVKQWDQSHDLDGHNRIWLPYIVKY